MKEKRWKKGSNERNYNMLTVRRKHERWMSRKEMRREKERRRHDAVEMER